MEEYIVSARKYRPDTFESVVGQDAITQTLKNSIKNNQLGQAYLFCGPRGVGKTTCARIFAKTINCSNPTENFEPCNECESCRAFIESRSFNIHELDAASNNSVEDIRALIEQVRIPPQIGSYSVYIIDEVHMLSQAAFNAFLKTLEEPPKHAIFILATTEKHKILSTILSRCQIFDFNRISIEDIRSRLEFVAQREGITAEQDALHVIAQKADGAMRDALSIFDQIVSFCGKNITYQETIKNLNVLDYEVYFKVTEALLAGNYPEALTIFDDVLKKGFEGGYFINGLASHYRDLLVCKDPKTINLIEVGEKAKTKYMEYAQKCSVSFLFNAIQIANSCDMSYRTSQNKRLLIELSLLKICNISTNAFALPQATVQAAPAQAPATPKPATVTPSQAATAPKPAPEAPVQKPAPKPQVAATPTPQTNTEPQNIQPAKAETEPQTGGKNLLQKIVGLEDKKEDENVKNTVTYGDKEFNIDDVLSAWMNFVSKYCPEGTRWRSYFKSHLPELNDKGAYIVRVEDEQMANKLSERKDVMANHIRKIIDNNAFDFTFTADNSLIEENSKKVMTQSELLEKIKETNPEVEKVITDGDFTQV